MSLRAVLLVVLLVPAAAQGCEVVLRNASGVDLAFGAKSQTVLVGPGESRRVPVAALTVIEFGAESRTFAPEKARKALCRKSNLVELEARPDGNLWLQATEQPEGLPLTPVEVQDLTQSPPNNSSKPTPLRGAA
jgi:hypothetical protein